MKRVFKLFAAANLMLPVPLAAAPAPNRDQPADTKAGDPNERVCEDVVVTGSRIATRRFCGTRAEWAERRRQDQDTVDKAQRDVNVGCSVINTHSGTPGC
jgi:hypothetical protein